MPELRLSIVFQALDRISAPIRRAAGRIMAAMRGVVQSVRRVNKAMEGLRKVSKKVGETARTLFTRLTLPIVGFGALTIRSAAQFEASMNRVGVLTGATGDRFDALEAQARMLGETTQFSATQAGDAMGFLAQAGFDTEKILAAMPGTLQLAAAAQMDLASAADIVSNVLTGYNLEASELARVNDVLVKTFASANTDLMQLGQAMKLAGPVAAGFGVKFEETAAAIGLMGNAGFQATLAGTALRGALSKLAKPAADARKALARIGIKKSDIFDSEGRIRSLTEIVAKLEAGGADAIDMMVIFGQRAGPAMQALLTQGSDALAKMTVELESAGGTAERVANAQMKGAAGAVRRLASAFEGLQLAIADSGLLEWFTAAVNKLTEWIGALSKLNPAILKWGSIIAIAAAAIAPLLIGLAAIGVAVNAMAIGMAILLSPIALVVAAIAAVAAAAFLIFENWEPIKQFFADLWDSILAGAKRVWDALQPILDGMATIAKFALNPIGGISNAVAGFFGAANGQAASEPSALAGGAARADVRGGITVDFQNPPPGMRVTGTQSNTPGFDIDAGMMMVSP